VPVVADLGEEVEVGQMGDRKRRKKWRQRPVIAPTSGASNV